LYFYLELESGFRKGVQSDNNMTLVKRKKLHTATERATERA
jgi:hypothetical protein